MGGLTTYTDLLRIREVRRILVLGLMVRIPLFGAFVVLVLHVVDHLGRSYGMAGLLDMASATAIAISGPWRGRLLDRMGLRRVLGPALAVYAACWVIAPWVGYWFLLVLVVVAGLFTPPVFTIVRQVIIAAVPDQKRTAALSLDGVFTEMSFMVGPVLGVLLATNLDT
ncbi:MAG: MFS transporter, partial [Myxococcales bacterium]